MDQLTFHSWGLDPFETPPGAVDFPIEVHGITLHYEASFTGKPPLLLMVRDPSGTAIVSQNLGLVSFGSGVMRGKATATFGLLINRPGRYAVTAEHDGKRYAETSFHIRQFPSISRE